MASGDIVNDKFHFRHDSKWLGRLGPPDGGGVLLCVACVIEMMESDDVASVRKSAALSGVSGMLKFSPGAVRELLQQDPRVSLHFITSLQGMLHSAEDPATLEQVVQVLVQLLLELQSEQYIRFVLDEIHTQLKDQLSLRGFLPTFTFLGRLVEVVPNLAQVLVAQYVPLLDCLCSALLYPDEGLKASLLYVWQRVCGAARGSAAQALPAAVRDRVCVLLLQTFANASSPQLIINCLGLLKQLVRQREAVSVLMNSPGDQILSEADHNLHTNNNQILGQNQEQQSAGRCPLPLILKKLLLSGDEMLQVAGAQCMAFILVHSPSQYSAPFILADVPEFLFERLASSGSEVLLWSVYSCLLPLTEEPLFFSQCHSVYGIESLVRSLMEALRLTNLEVQKQGLLLLTEILERQPSGVRLFPSGPGFVAVAEAVVTGVSSSCLQVATQAAHAASALLRLNHQSSPVQYKEVEALVEAVTNRCSELPLPSSARRTGSQKRSDPGSQASRSVGFLLQALVCFQAACRLAEQCASEPFLKENAFTAPSKQGRAQDSLESLCRCLLHCCDTVCIPTVTRMCEHAPSVQVLQCFYSILSSQFTLLPSLMPVFARKLASSGFYRLALEHKALLCAGNRNPNLNASCCGFLQKLSMCLLSQADRATSADQHDSEEEEVEELLRCGLPSLCSRVSDWPALLREAPGLRLPDSPGAGAAPYCLLVMLHLALQQGDRLLPDQTVFSSVVWLLRSVQEQGDCPLPRSVLRSALYLLAVTQDKSPTLDGAPLNCVSQALSSCQSFSSLYIHHPPLLHFICHHPELAERFGPPVLELWLTRQAGHTPPEQTTLKADKRETGEKRARLAEERRDQQPDPDTVQLLTLIEKHPAVMLILLGMVCTREAPLAERALRVLGVFLQGQRGCEADLCAQLRPALLQALQRLSVENSQGRGQEHSAGVDSLPVVLKLLCVMQASDSASCSSDSDTDGTHFKLLYHVSNLAGRLKPTNTDSLLPALSYLYCCLSLSPAHCTDRAVSMLLSNTGLMDQLQTILSSSSSSSSSSSPSTPPSSALLCCCRLLLSSLITLQRVHSAQVHKRVSWSLDSAMRCLLFQKGNTDSLLLVSSLRLLQALLDVDLASAVVCVSSSPGLAGPRPLGDTDSALYPLGSRGARCLTTALYGLLLQKQELLLRVSLNCLGSLLSFLRRKSPTTAQYVVCQPWSRFLLHSLLSSGASCLLHPATLTLITLLLQQGSSAVLWDPDLLQVMEAVERRGVKELGQEAAQALRLLLTQLQSSVLRPPLTEEHRRRVRSAMEALGPSLSHSPPSTILRVGDLSICLSDLALKASGCSGRP